MATHMLSPAKIYYAKVIVITIAISLLILKSDQEFTKPLLILALLSAGYYLGKITCSVHLKNTGIGITILVFVLMNLVHSLIDGISFSGQAFIYWLVAIGGHELIRQPTLYIVLWAILRPVEKHNYIKFAICFFSVTIVWVIGIALGKISGSSISHIYNVADWVGYSIFLFIGDIIHHIVDQHRLIQQKKHQPDVK